MNELEIGRHSAAAEALHHGWGWEVPVYLFLGGLAAGVMMASALLALRGARPSRRIAFSAPLLVTLGMIALLLDLEGKQHVLRFYLSFHWHSPMSWGAWILIAVYPVSVLFALSLVEEAELAGAGDALRRLRLDGALRSVWGWARVHPRRLAAANAILGAMLGVYTGVLLSLLVARPLWNSALLGPLFLASGFSGGAALLLLGQRDEQVRHRLARWDRWAMVAELALIALFLAGLANSGADHREAVGLLLGGRFTAEFWTGVVVLGLVVPLLLETAAERLRRPLPLIAPALVLIGGFSLRWILVAAGQA